MPLAVTMTTEQKDLITLAPKTASGAAGKLSDVPVYAVTSGDVTLDAPSADGLSQSVLAGTTAGGVVTVTDPATGLTDTITYTVTDAAVTDLGVTDGGVSAK